MVVNGGVLEVSEGDSTLVATRPGCVGSAMTPRSVSVCLPDALSPQFTAGTVRSGPKARGEVVGYAGSPRCPGFAPDGYVSGLV